MSIYCRTGHPPTPSSTQALIMVTNAAFPASLHPPNLVEGEGFEPSKAVPSDLQSDPFDRSGTPPSETSNYECIVFISQRTYSALSSFL